MSSDENLIRAWVAMKGIRNERTEATARHLKLVRAVACLIISLAMAQQASADTLVTNAVVSAVMVGNSSAGQDQVWFTVQGQPTVASSDCMSGGAATFYIPNDGNIGQDHAEALLLTAKATGQHVSIIYNVQPAVADMWIFGTTKCAVARLAISN